MLEWMLIWIVLIIELLKILSNMEPLLVFIQAKLLEIREVNLDLNKEKPEK